MREFKCAYLKNNNNNNNPWFLAAWCWIYQILCLFTVIVGAFSSRVVCQMSGKEFRRELRSEPCWWTNDGKPFFFYLNLAFFFIVFPVRVPCRAIMFNLNVQPGDIRGILVVGLILALWCLLHLILFLCLFCLLLIIIFPKTQRLAGIGQKRKVCYKHQFKK